MATKKTTKKKTAKKKISKAKRSKLQRPIEPMPASVRSALTKR